MPDSSPIHVCSIPTVQVSAFSSPVIVLPMIRRRHSLTLTGLVPMSSFFNGTSLHARRIDAWSCGMVSVVRCLARVAISSPSFVNGCHMILNKFHVNLCWSSRPWWVFSTWCDFHLELCFHRWPSMFWFQACQLWLTVACACFSFIFFMMSIVMSCFPSMSSALSTNLRTFFAAVLVLVALVYRRFCGLIVFWI